MCYLTLGEKGILFKTNEKSAINLITAINLQRKTAKVPDCGKAPSKMRGQRGVKIQKNRNLFLTVMNVHSNEVTRYKTNTEEPKRKTQATDYKKECTGENVDILQSLFCIQKNATREVKKCKILKLKKNT